MQVLLTSPFNGHDGSNGTLLAQAARLKRTITHVMLLGAVSVAVIGCGGGGDNAGPDLVVASDQMATSIDVLATNGTPAPPADTGEEATIPVEADESDAEAEPIATSTF